MTASSADARRTSSCLAGSAGTGVDDEGDAVVPRRDELEVGSATSTGPSGGPGSLNGSFLSTAAFFFDVADGGGPAPDAGLPADAAAAASFFAAFCRAAFSFFLSRLSSNLSSPVPSTRPPNGADAVAVAGEGVRGSDPSAAVVIEVERSSGGSARGGEESGRRERPTTAMLGEEEEEAREDRGTAEVVGGWPGEGRAGRGVSGSETSEAAERWNSRGSLSATSDHLAERATAGSREVATAQRVERNAPSRSGAGELLELHLTSLTSTLTLGPSRPFPGGPATPSAFSPPTADAASAARASLTRSRLASVLSRFFSRSAASRSGDLNNVGGGLIVEEEKESVGGEGWPRAAGGAGGGGGGWEAEEDTVESGAAEDDDDELATGAAW